MREQLGRTTSVALFLAATLVMTGPALANGATTRAAPTSRPVAASRARALANGPTVVAADPQPLDRSFTWYHGLGFDAASAPTLASMQAWLASPYRAIGIYIGGVGRFDQTQTNLTASWVRLIATVGWKAQPIYEGLQAPAPCYAGPKPKMTTGLESAQGHDAALDAVTQARALGIGSGSDIYYDMEAYTPGTSCSGSVLKFLSGWTSTLRANGYSSGVYGSLASGIADVANPTALPGFVAPDKTWIARYDGKQGVYGYAPYVLDSQFSPYRRMHQYAGGHTETYGGVTINIDSSYLDTDPNRGNPFGQIDAVAGGPSKVTARGWAIDPDTRSPTLVQMYVDSRANAVTRANLPRPDVGSSYPAAGPDHGYTLTMAATPGRHTVCLYAINAGPGFSRLLGCRVVTAASSNPFGVIDTVTTRPGAVTARGWAIDPDTSSPILVQMYVDSRANAVTWASRPRPDVGAVYPAAGPNHGYTLSLAATAGRHTVCLYAINTGPGATRTLGCRAVTVP